jgi:RNA polymerase sigma-70 factor (ECF subfamily)
LHFVRKISEASVTHPFEERSLPVQESPNVSPADAAAHWLHEHGDALYSFALSRLENADAAEELVQDTLVTAMEAHERFAGRSSERTWLVGILRHKLLAYVRQRRRAPVALDVDGELPPSVVEGEFTRRGRWKHGPKKWGGEPKSQTEADDLRSVLRGCLAKLPPRTAEAFIMAECEDVPVDTLLRVLDISTANHVYVILHRARAALRQCVERMWLGVREGGRFSP